MTHTKKQTTLPKTITPSKLPASSDPPTFTTPTPQPSQFPYWAAATRWWGSEACCPSGTSTRQWRPPDSWWARALPGSSAAWVPSDHWASGGCTLHNNPPSTPWSKTQLATRSSGYMMTSLGVCIAHCGWGRRGRRVGMSAGHATAGKLELKKRLVCLSMSASCVMHS